VTGAAIKQSFSTQSGQKLSFGCEREVAPSAEIDATICSAATRALA